MLPQQEAQAILQRYFTIMASVNQAQAVLVAVSKSQSHEAMAVLAKAGHKHFGENYWQEAQEKMLMLRDFPIIWHFIGRIQHNKVESIAQHFDWVHSVDSAELINAMSIARATVGSPLKVCLQVNISQEPKKGGVNPQNMLELADKVAAEPQLSLRGLMAIPDVNGAREKDFAVMHKLWIDLKQKHASVDTLSLGMSADYLQALEAGATMVRIGQGIFGARDRN